MASSNTGNNGNAFTNYLVSRKNQVGLLLAILFVVLYLTTGLAGAFWPVAAVAAYGAGAALTPAPKQKALPAPVHTPTPHLLEDAMRETSGRIFKASPPSAVLTQVKELEANVRFVLSQWDHLEPTPEHRQTMWNIVKIYYPEITATYLGAPQYQDSRAVSVFVDSLNTLTQAAGRIKNGILEDNLRAMDSQAQFLRSEFGALPGLDDGYNEISEYDGRP